jgi:hypothetical protein
VSDQIPQRADLLTPPWNFAVVQLPGRRFPGVVFQGDSLAAICEQAAQLVDECDGASNLSVQLDAIVRGYIAVLDQRGITPPFTYRPRAE